MHSQSIPTNTFDPTPVLNFAWLELTNRCNLQCSHCYSESSPRSGDEDALTEEDYRALLDDLRRAGCERVQFIGGEPTLNRGLPSLIRHARHLSFQSIEVFTNLFHIENRLVQCFLENDVAVATSFYSHRSSTHDAITSRADSFANTVGNIKRLIAAGVNLRVGIILMDENREDADETEALLRGLGVKSIGFDSLRHIGRASGQGCGELGELCGSCAGGSIAIGPDGIVSPCTMSRMLKVGSVFEQPLAQILSSRQLLDARRAIYDAVVLPAALDGKAASGCKPCGPNGGPCWPNGR